MLTYNMLRIYSYQQCLAALNPSVLNIRRTHTHTLSLRLSHVLHHTVRILQLFHTITSARWPLRGHVASLQRRVCVRDGQQIMITESAPYACVGVEQTTGIAPRNDHFHVIG